MATSGKKFLSVVLCVGFFVSCDDSKKSSANGGPRTTGNAGIDEIVAAFCGSVRSCCSAAGHSSAALDGCESSYSGAELFQAVLDGTIVFREPERTECVASIRALAESCGSLTQDSPCYDMFEGVLGELATCEEAEECRGNEVGVACVHISHGDDEAPGPGMCRSLSAGQLDSPCIRTVDEDGVYFGTTGSEQSTVVVCDRRAGLYCAYDSITIDGITFDYTCQPLVAAGAPCEDSDACPNGYYCEGTCVSRLTTGAACTAYGQCADGLECVDDVCAVPKLTDGDICEGDVT